MVVDSAANGFTVRETADIAAEPADVYRALVDHVGQWWDKAHTFSGDATHLSIDARPGGCFCERLDAGGGVQHMTVVFAAPGRLLRMRGALGPLQDQGATGAMTWTLTPAAGGRTHLELTYRVTGYTPGGLQAWAPPVDRVLQLQFQRLQRFVETGKPDAR